MALGALFWGVLGVVISTSAFNRFGVNSATECNVSVEAEGVNVSVEAETVSSALSSACHETTQTDRCDKLRGRSFALCRHCLVQALPELRHSRLHISNTCVRNMQPDRINGCSNAFACQEHVYLQSTGCQVILAKSRAKTSKVSGGCNCNRNWMRSGYFLMNKHLLRIRMSALA